MKKLLALILALVVSVAGADTTGNLISGTSWTGVTNGSLPTSRMPGSVLLYDTATGTVNWSYTQATAAKTIAINNALSGTGIQVGGYNYTYDLRNMNGDDRQGSIDTMTVVTKMTSNTGATLLTNTNTHNTKFDWTTFNGTQSLNSALPLSGLGNLSISFNSKDSGYWAGYFGPEVRNVGMSLNYTVDPCVTNPAYSTTCANYNTVSISNNLFTGTTGAQAYAINTALASAGAGTMIHGFDYGYNYRAAGRDCAIWNLFGVCLSGWNYSDASVTTTLTNSAGVVGYTETNTHSGGNNGISGTYSKSLRLSSSVPMTTLGIFTMTPTTNGDASITNMYSKAVYTPDPCTANPLSSTSCAGYATAYQDQQCSINPLYATTCAGYAVAYTSQQCRVNALYNSSCPGYEQAYHDQQCSSNPLYASDCIGYAQSYKTQQCSADPLYATDCPGYSVAYHDQQCRVSALYANDCPGYAVAYHDQQCSISALFMSDCPGYAVAYKTQQCNLNALYATDCPGYAVAFKSQQCTANSLYASDCPGYAVAYKNQQCSISALYATDCPGYATAYHTNQCAVNPLYMNDCPGYAAAYKSQQCGISALYAIDCPGYDAAYKTQQCSLNSLYASDCPGYAVAYKNQQCTANPLYANDCPGYSTSYNKKTATETALKPAETIPVVTTASVISTTLPGISDSAVSAAITTPSTTSATSPTSVTSVVNTAPSVSSTNPTSPTLAATTAASTPAPTAPAQAQETKKTEGAVASVEKKAGGDKAAAKAAATEKAKELANDMSKAATMEQQAANQGLLVGLIGYVPGFTAYQNSMVPDINAAAVARQYHKPNVDNRNAQRRLSGASERAWQEMVDSQYQLGK